MFHRILFDLSVVLVFATMISVLVAAHEFGHYIFARWFGMGIEEFSIGFGKPVLLTYRRKKYLLPLTDDEAKQELINKSKPPIIDQIQDPISSKTMKLLDSLEGGTPPNDGEDEFKQIDGKYFLQETTNFTIRPWPIGGFVRIKGMMPDEEGGEVHVPGGFYNKSSFARLAVLFAGPLFSVLAGVLVLIPIFMFVGIQKQSLKPEIGILMVGMPAQKAGIRLKDRILSVNGQPISNFYQVVKAIRYDGVRPVKLGILRAGKILSVVVIPQLDKTPTPLLDHHLNPTGISKVQSKIGVMTILDTVHLSFPKAVTEAVLVPIDTVSGLVGGILHPSGLKSEVGGPETMVKATADATQTSLSSIFELAAYLSISLGVLNLLPVPPLDGGQMLVAFAELLRGGRRLSLKVQGIVFTAGLALVGLLMISVIVIDIGRYQFAPQVPQHKILQYHQHSSSNNAISK